jgi:LysR family glycine cleavage system transcriptional activator
MGARAKNSALPQPSSPARAGRPRLPPLKSLQAFEAACRHGSFAQGAVELGVTPSAVSHQIQQLEEFLGVSLFQRRAGRAVLSGAGQNYAREIEHALSIIGAATEVVAPQSQSGHLAIAAGPSFAGKWLQPRLPGFLRAHPSIRIRLSTIASADDLEDSRFDLAIVYGSPPGNQRRVEPLVVERLRPLCSPALAAAIDLRTPGDLARATLIHSANAFTWSEYLRQIGIGALQPDNELWLDRSTMAIDAAVDGLGVVLESELLTQQELRDGRLIAPFGDQTNTVERTSYFLVRPRGGRVGRPAAAFEKWLRDAIS